MFKRILLVALLMVTPLNTTNGYYQTAEITIEGIEGTCYGTLISRKAMSGTWSTKIELDLNAPEEIKDAFKNHEDPDGFLYLNYFQDVSEGYLWWPYYPPEDFKLLLYYPETDTFMTSDVYSPYCLTSMYKATVKDGNITLVRNFDYAEMIKITLIRILVCSALAILVSVLYGRPFTDDIKHIVLSNLIYHVILHGLIAWYSYMNGFSIYEYYLLMWIPYLLFMIIQSYIYSRKAHSIHMPGLCAFYGCGIAYAAGLLMVDVFPKLFTIAK